MRLRGTLIVFAMSILIFLQATNISLLTTAQSAIAAELDAFENVTWFTSAYLVAMSSIAPLVGRLCTVFPPKQCMFTASVIFAIGSLITGLAPHLDLFLVGRVVTGVGASGIFTVSLIVVLQLATDERRGLFIGLLNTGYTVGVSVGAVLSGALEPVIGWRALFWGQSPFVIIAGLVLLIKLPDFSTSKYNSRTDVSLRQKLARLDYLGAVTLTATIFLMLLGLSSPTIQILPIVLSLIILPIFVFNEAYLASDPVIPVVILKSRGMLFSCIATLGFMMSRWTILFYTPVYAISVRQWHSAKAGSILIPTNAGFALGGILVGWLHIKRSGSFYIPSIVANILFPLSLLSMSYASTATSSTALFVSLTFVNGMITGSSLNYTLSHLLHLTPTHTHFIASSLLATFRGFAGSFGSAIGGGVFTRTLQRSLTNGFVGHGLGHKTGLVRKLLGSPALVGTLGEPEKSIAIGAYVDATRGLFAAAAGLTALMVLAQAATGWRAAEPKKAGDEENDRMEETLQPYRDDTQSDEEDHHRVS
ncbi:MFS multidrug transporter-like protein [Eremomyces bilateralis CBS 781.70]|uniref:MFS multidrug transporter-like protein n=1 Tax=Eremomyces bilateralis CBS 781.70 TaxID=1392243 RepID=A0A6G1FXC7_9PEZI|nr:MFS multidrug transporter-like protein [Eremomyces bilateralis CBS 781.70]KAF1810487.1 MFS multidrug transporter-like protein [Eremomyces bilateralis CBS 781.70]